MIFILHNEIVILVALRVSVSLILEVEIDKNWLYYYDMEVNSVIIQNHQDF